MNRSTPNASRNSVLLQAEFVALSATTALIVIEQLRGLADTIHAFLRLVF